MVRLSLIVLGLLAAVWCFSGTTEGIQVTIVDKYTSVSCGKGQVIKVGKCYWSIWCARVSYTSGSVRCISRRSVRNIKRCNKRSSCRVSSYISKGRYVCKYRCVQKPRPSVKKTRRIKWTRRCNTRSGRRRCHLYKRKCYLSSYRTYYCKKVWWKRCHWKYDKGNHCHRPVRRQKCGFSRLHKRSRCRWVRKRAIRRKKRCVKTARGVTCFLV